MFKNETNKVDFVTDAILASSKLHKLKNKDFPANYDTMLKMERENHEWAKTPEGKKWVFKMLDKF